jgi:drug/metabolite transporter (DMT)-like permease
MDWRVLGIACALGSAASWAIGTILYKAFVKDVSASALTLVKGVLSLAMLAAALVVVGTSGAMTWEAAGLLALSGVLGIALGDVFFFKALQHLSAHLLILLTLTGQIFTVLLALGFLGETISATVGLGISLTIAGLCLSLWEPKDSHEPRTSGRGLIFGLLAMLCMSVGVIVTKSGIERVGALEATTLRMVSGVVAIAVWGAISGQMAGWLKPFRQPRLIGQVLLAVAVTALGGFWLSHIAIKHLDVSVANTLNSSEPLFALPLAAFLLREKVRWNAIVGALVAVGGIVLITLG